jgi:FKBP-type peptidyl-prolyl cis-trans isomerase
LLLKKILKPAEQPDKCPSWDTKVIVHYHGTTLDGKVFDSSVARSQPFDFMVGQGSVIKGWDKGVPTMNVGEKALFILHPDVAYGESGSGSIPGGACLSFEIELLDYIESDHEFPASPEERI